MTLFLFHAPLGLAPPCPVGDTEKKNKSATENRQVEKVCSGRVLRSRLRCFH